MKIVRTFVALAGLLLLTACFAPSKADLIKKAQGASSRAELEAALGEPSEVLKLGPIGKWTYVASDGLVVFLLAGDTVTRSEEHTSELQSLMRILYAVFCLKKKITKKR